MNDPAQRGFILGALTSGIFSCALFLAGQATAQGEQSPPPAANAPVAGAPATPGGATGASPAVAPQASPPTPPAPPPASDDRFSRAELEKLLAPVALFPDPLLAQVLPASAYPLQIVEAERWIEKHPTAVKKNDFAAIDAKKWDPAVKALVRFPDLIKRMAANLQWTADLGDAMVNQAQDVAEVIQLLRERAQKAGSLKSTDQQKVETRRANNRETIAIQPADPNEIYVPIYDPATVYDPGAALLGFGAAVAIGSIWAGDYWDWDSGAVYPPVWPGYPGWRPPYPGWRPGRPPVRPGGPGGPGGIGGPGRPGGIGPGGPGGIGGIGGPGRPGSPIGGIGSGARPWQPIAGQYRPGQGSKPGIGGAQRPTGGAGNVARPGTQPAREGAGAGGGLGAGATAAGAAAAAGVAAGAAKRATPAARAKATKAKAAARPTKARAKPKAARGGRASTAHRGARVGPRHPVARPSHFGGMRGGARIRGGGFGGMRGGGGFRGAGGRGGGGRGGGGRRSDIRLKDHIELIGILENGIGFYRFRYKGQHQAHVGVMAQEVQSVRPDAVIKGRDGYLRVRYDKLGIPFESWNEWVAGGRQIPSARNAEDTKTHEFGPERPL